MRAEHEDVERGHHSRDVTAKSGEEERARDAEAIELSLDEREVLAMRRVPLMIADDHESRVGHHLEHALRRARQRHVILLRRHTRSHADHRGVIRDAELAAHRSARLGRGWRLHVQSVVQDATTRRTDAIGERRPRVL